MTAVWILLFVCTASLPSCSQGDVSVANQSYTSREEGYDDGEQHPVSPDHYGAPCAGWKIWRRLAVYSIVTMYE
jgi:hypothetical protein